MIEFWNFLKYKVFAPIGEWIVNLFSGKTNELEEYCTPFCVSEYFSRVEQYNLEIQEERRAVDKIIILWWGLDGLRLNENGSLEWISRSQSIKMFSGNRVIQ